MAGRLMVADQLSIDSLLLVRVKPGGSLKRDGFYCRYCDFEQLNAAYLPGESMRQAAVNGAEHMRTAHGAQLDGTPLWLGL